MRLRILNVIVALLIGIGAAGVEAAEVIDDVPEAVTLYAKGKRMLRQGDWFEASKTFEELAGRFSNSDNLDLFVFNRAKAEYYLGQYDKAIARLSFFVTRFVRSAELPYAYFFRANAYYLNGDLSRSIDDYLQSYRLSKSEKLDNLAVSSLRTVFTNAQSVSIGRDFFESLPEPKKCPLVKALGQILADKGELRRAQEILGACGLSVAQSGTDVSNLLRDRDFFEIAVVLPFSGELNSFAEDIYNGAVIAAEQFRKQTGQQMKLVPYDSKGDPVDAAQIVAELAGSYRADAVIGPLTSEAAAVVAAAASCDNIPLIVPAATQSGLTRLSNSTFQLSPNIDLEGLRMAEYAVNELGADSAAIITSTANDHLRMSRAFADHFRSLGGHIVAIEYYRSRDRDFGKLIRDIKAILLGYHPDSVYYIDETGDTLEADEISVNLDCIYLPGDPSQLRLLIPQIRFYSLNSSYLGSDGWGDDAILKLGDNVTGQAVFPSPFLSTGSSDAYFQFAATYDARYGVQPTRLANLGYDAVQLIGEAVTKGYTSPEAISEYLRTVSGFDGASGKISFGPNRENMEMPLYRIEMEQALPLHQIEKMPDSTTAPGTE
jgi:branched-chain amino acid transport system substrate-binding protein